jgi:predicted amidohydrolase
MFLHPDATVDKVAELTAKIAPEGAEPVVLPEAFAPTYLD